MYKYSGKCSCCTSSHNRTSKEKTTNCINRIQQQLKEELIITRLFYDPQMGYKTL